MAVKSPQYASKERRYINRFMIMNRIFKCNKYWPKYIKINILLIKVPTFLPIFLYLFVRTLPYFSQVRVQKFIPFRARSYRLYRLHILIYLCDRNIVFANWKVAGGRPILEQELLVLMLVDPSD